MGTISASSIADRASALLNDLNKVHWSGPFLMDGINTAQREIVRLKPVANTLTFNYQTVPGTKQTIPAGNLSLVHAGRNMGADGATSGRVITFVDKHKLDQYLPDWQAAPANSEAVHYTQIKGENKDFYLFPPQPNTPWEIEITCNVLPDNVLDASDPITLDDEYQDAIFYYIMFYSHSQESKSAEKSKAAGFYNLFLTTLGIQQSTEATNKAPR